MFSEGQRKANFEEYDAKKRENAEKISDLKKKVRELYTKYAGAKNVTWVTERKEKKINNRLAFMCKLMLNVS